MTRGRDAICLVKERLRDERGRIERDTPNRVALAYPSPYRAAMSSLGYQTIYRLIQHSGEFSAARVFAPDRGLRWGHGAPEVSYETGQSLSAFGLIAFSISYELELGPLLGMLHRAGVGVQRAIRGQSDPLVIVGGPLTLSNPAIVEPYADAIVVGEADALVTDLLVHSFSHPVRHKRLEALASLPSVWVPSLHGNKVPAAARSDESLLPAWGPIRTPHTELRDMFLIEAVRGCSRRCNYCVMRGRRGQGMRIIAAQKILDLIPEQAHRVGLVGAAVSDHPNIVDIVNSLAERGCRVGLSSLRPERLNRRFVQALRAGGYRTVTTAMDGASQRLRTQIERKTTADHLFAATTACREAKVERLKLYLMVGLPGETLEDLNECAELIRALSKILPISIGVSAFCAKKGTPLQGASFAGTDVIDRHIKHLRRRIAGRADIKATSARWAWVEHVLAGGGSAEGRAVLDAEQAGGTFAHYRKAFEALGYKPR
ncbi:MAG: radical SAM protein [Sorangium cellulosum]|nr:MAG: radical SAM protein [Sorangium cellulosum]